MEGKYKVCKGKKKKSHMKLEIEGLETELRGVHAVYPGQS